MKTSERPTSFQEVFSKMADLGMATPSQGFEIRVPNAKSCFTEAMNAVLSYEGKQAQWLPEYDEVVAWLENSGGRSLFLYGNCGRGKSLIARFIVPSLILQHYERIFSVYDAIEFAQKIEASIRNKFIVVDDVGTEDFTNDFGSRRMAFSELMDSVEKNHKVVVITTNLNVEQLRVKYGDRTVERIISTCKRVCFQGKSLRS